ncbi:hypothetical protein EI165_08615 [Pseudoalteromonas nigrifaciens]|uniref:hypothetical protein n=1 Tax=Pseudoalteromonas nigrifaciens TaxID=28109 RepID=UPI00178876F6|nr:hypothetical protein [Pseudoalteromonas nigrifaciens]MBE0420185.1 hypothetical protein [Pseudoalteromonas nigrifaciens]
MLNKAICDYKMKKLVKNSNLRSPMVLSCVVETYLIAADYGISIFSVGGEAMIPFFNGQVVTNYEYKHMVENELPILLYNQVMKADFPEITEFKRGIKELEESLVKLKDNVWVKLILKHYYENQTFDKQMLLDFSDKKATEYGAARAHYNAYCGVALEKIQKILMVKANAKLVKSWLERKKRGVL